MWESHVTWGTPVQSFVFLGLLVFELEPMYATSDGQTDGRTTDADDRLMPPPPLWGRGHNNKDIKKSKIYLEDHLPLVLWYISMYNMCLLMYVLA